MNEEDFRIALIENLEKIVKVLDGIKEDLDEIKDDTRVLGEHVANVGFR